MKTKRKTVKKIVKNRIKYDLAMWTLGHDGIAVKVLHTDPRIRPQARCVYDGADKFVCIRCEDDAEETLSVEGVELNITLPKTVGKTCFYPTVSIYNDDTGEYDKVQSHELIDYIKMYLVHINGPEYARRPYTIDPIIFPRVF